MCCLFAGLALSGAPDAECASLRHDSLPAQFLRSHPMNDEDLRYLRAAIALARQAREHGNRPFGAVLVGANGRILGEAENTAATTGDSTGHAELNLIREVCPAYPRDELAAATLYASGEPCPMCATAIFWSGIGRVVFGISSHIVYEMAGDPPDQLRLSTRDVLASGRRPVQVEGPVIEEEARQVFEGFF
jgi:tRNA(adenine34) deaminase